MLLRRQLMMSAALITVFAFVPSAIATGTGSPAPVQDSVPIAPNAPIVVDAAPTGNFIGNPPANPTAIDASKAPTDANFAALPSTSNAVTLTVDATSINPLHYQWRVTDGNVVDVDAPTTTWTLAAGPGIHFAYVLVSDGLGGFSEGHIAVNTDDNPSSIPVARNVYKTTRPDVAKAPAPTPRSSAATQIIGQILLGDASSCGVRNPFFGVNVNAVIELFDRNNTGLGRFVVDPYSYMFAIDDNPAATTLSITCEGATAQFTNFRRSTVAAGLVATPPSTNFFILPGTQRPAIKSVTATQDGRNIGYFPLTPSARLPSDFVIGRLGDKLIGPPAHFLAYKGLDTRKGSCGYYKATGVIGGCDDSGNFTGPRLTFTQWRRESRIAEFTPVRPNIDEVAIFINKLDLNLTRDHHAIQTTLDDVSAYVCNHPGPAPDPAPSSQNPTATGTDPTGLFSTQDRVNAAIEDVTRVDDLHPQGRNLLACVAMDRRPVTSVTGDPIRTHVGDVFTRFMIFGPDGELLPSVNLDGQGEKFVPGACVACHGGSNYFRLTGIQSPGTPNLGGFRERVAGDVTASFIRDLGAYFLPFDVENLQFHSTRAGLTEDEEDSTIRVLNEIVTRADNAVAVINGKAKRGETTRFDTLFRGFYPDDAPAPFAKGAHVAPAYTGSEDARDFYRNVVARSCRTCHIAMDDADFEGTRDDPVTLRDPVYRLRFQPFVCDASAGTNPARFESTIFTGDANLAYLMPNARVTFDRFWLSDRSNVAGQPAGTVSQPKQTRTHLINALPDGKLIAERCFLPPQ